MRGCGRVLKRKNGTLAISYRANGREVRESVAKLVGKRPRDVTERDAERALQRRLGEVHGGSFVGLAQERITVNEILEGYLASCQTRGKKALPTIKSHVGFLGSVFGAERARALTGL